MDSEQGLKSKGNVQGFLLCLALSVYFIALGQDISGVGAGCKNSKDSAGGGEEGLNLVKMAGFNIVLLIGGIGGYLCLKSKQLKLLPQRISAGPPSSSSSTGESKSKMDLKENGPDQSGGNDRCLDASQFVAEAAVGCLCSVLVTIVFQCLIKGKKLRMPDVMEVLVVVATLGLQIANVKIEAQIVQTKKDSSDKIKQCLCILIVCLAATTTIGSLSVMLLFSVFDCVFLSMKNYIREVEELELRIGESMAAADEQDKLADNIIFSILFDSSAKEQVGRPERVFVFQKGGKDSLRIIKKWVDPEYVGDDSQPVIHLLRDLSFEQVVKEVGLTKAEVVESSRPQDDSLIRVNSFESEKNRSKSISQDGSPLILPGLEQTLSDFLSSPTDCSMLTLKIKQDGSARKLTISYLGANKQNIKLIISSKLPPVLKQKKVTSRRDSVMRLAMHQPDLSDQGRRKSKSSEALVGVKSYLRPRLSFGQFSQIAQQAEEQKEEIKQVEIKVQLEEPLEERTDEARSKMLHEDIRRGSMSSINVSKCLDVKKNQVRKGITSTNLINNQFTMISPKVQNKTGSNVLKNQKIIEGLREKIKKLENQLATNQIFLNMVIHDMRNPASCIQFALKDAIEMIHERKVNLEDLLALSIANSERMAKLHEEKLEGSFRKQEQLSDLSAGDCSPEIQIHQSKIKEFSLKLDTRLVSIKSQVQQIDENLAKIKSRNELSGSNSIATSEILDSSKLEGASFRMCQTDAQQDAIFTEEDESNIQLASMNPKSFLSLFKGKKQQLLTTQVVEQMPPLLKSNTQKMIPPMQRLNPLIDDCILELSQNIQEAQSSGQESSLEIGGRCECCSINKVFYDSFNQLATSTLKESIPQQLVLLENSLFSVTMLLNLINDLLDLAKMENSKFTLNEEYFDLNQTIRQAFEVVKFLASEKNICLKLEYSESVQASQVIDKGHPLFDDYTKEEKVQHFFDQLLGDQRRYFQILLNFLSNALKFTPENGQIVVELHLKDLQDLTTEEAFSPARRLTVDIQAPKIRLDPGKLQNSVYRARFVKFTLKIKDSGVGIAKDNLANLFVNFGKLSEHEKINTQGTGLGLSICKQIVENMGGSVHVESELGKGSSFNVVLTAKCREKMKKPPLETGALHLQIQSTSSFIVGGVPISPQVKRRSLVSKIRDLNPIKQGADDLIESNKKDMISKFKELQIKSITLQNPKYKCLAANDSDFQLMAMECNLKKCGVEVLKAHNGFQAVEIAKLHFQELDFVILDLEMPILTGYEACQKLIKLMDESQYHLFQQHTDGAEHSRLGESKQASEISPGNPMNKEMVSIYSDLLQNIENPYLSNGNMKKIPIIAFSGFVNEAISQKCTRSGFNICLQAPLTTQKIQELILEKIVQDKTKLKKQKKMLEQEFILENFTGHQITESPLIDGMSPVQSKFYDSPKFNGQDSTSIKGMEIVSQNKRSLSHTNLLKISQLTKTKHCKVGKKLEQIEEVKEVETPDVFMKRPSLFQNYKIEVTKEPKNIQVEDKVVIKEEGLQLQKQKSTSSIKPRLPPRRRDTSASQAVISRKLSSNDILGIRKSLQEADFPNISSLPRTPSKMSLGKIEASASKEREREVDKKPKQPYSNFSDSISQGSGLKTIKNQSRNQTISGDPRVSQAADDTPLAFYKGSILDRPTAFSKQILLESEESS